jgi:putative ABC transport system permease protein
MSTLRQDLQYGARMLVKKPGFTLVATIALALGIGANTAIFSVVNAVLLRPLPFAEPDRLVRIWESNPGRGWPEFSASEPNYYDWARQNEVFEQVAALQGATFNLTGTGEPERIIGVFATANIFQTLGVAPVYGRSFLDEEDRPGAPRVVILSHAIWQRQFGADTALVGKTINLNGESSTVVGVLPAEFRFTSGTELWVPLARKLAESNRSNHILSVFARLKPGVTLEQAEANMATIAGRLEQQYPASNAGWGVRLRSFYDWAVPEQTRRSILVLLGAVGFVLLIACSNVANLLLARATTRQREMAIRLALGASRARVMRQLLTESLLLAALGGFVGVLLALWGTDVLASSTSINISRLEEARLDARVLGFTLLTSLATGLIFGLAPAWHASKPNLNETLKEGGRSGRGGAARHRLHGALVIGETALALVLLVSAGLMIRSFAHLQNVPLGFAPENVMTMQINLPVSKYGENQGRVDFFNQLLERVRTVPGVVDAAAITQVPFSGGNWAMEVKLEGGDAATDGAALSADARAITPAYFKTMGIPLISGRDFTEQDQGNSPLTLIVSESFASRYWPNEDPIGKRFRAGTGNPLGTVIGVVGNVRNLSLDNEGRPAFYFANGHIGMPGLTVAVRAAAHPETLTAALRAQVSSLDRDLPVYNIRTMERIVSDAAGQPRFQTALLALFGVVALILAAVGLYGVMAYSVTERTHEIGVRMALGAQTSDVLKLIIKQGMTLTFVGVAMGLIAAFVLTRLLKSLLYGVSATDPLVFAIISLVLLSVALVACAIPARRAMKVDPGVALRYE